MVGPLVWDSQNGVCPPGMETGNGFAEIYLVCRTTSIMYSSQNEQAITLVL